MKARKSNFTRLRILLVGVTFAVGFAVIGGNALLLHVNEGSWLIKKAFNQVEDSLKAVGKRGAILDRRGREMAVSVDVTSVAIRPALVKDVESAARDLKAKTMKAQRALKAD